MAKSAREQDIGTTFEERFARIIGGREVEGSGRGAFVKGDVRGSGVIFSCKATKHGSFSVTKPTFHEARQIARHMGGLPALAVELDGEAFVVMAAEDYTELMAGDVTFERTKQSSKRLAVRTPPPLRGE